MITEALLSVVTSIVSWVATLMPDIDLGIDASAIDSLGGTLGSAVGFLALWVPVSLVVGGVSAILALEGLVAIWGFIVWVYHQFWGAS